MWSTRGVESWATSTDGTGLDLHLDVGGAGGVRDGLTRALREAIRGARLPSSRSPAAEGMCAVPLPMDEHGAGLGALTGGGAGGVLLTPAHQFASGATLRPARPRVRRRPRRAVRDSPARPQCPSAAFDAAEAPNAFSHDGPLSSSSSRSSRVSGSQS